MALKLAGTGTGVDKLKIYLAADLGFLLILPLGTDGLLERRNH